MSLFNRLLSMNTPLSLSQPFPDANPAMQEITVDSGAVGISTNSDDVEANLVLNAVSPSAADEENTVPADNTASPASEDAVNQTTPADGEEILPSKDDSPGFFVG